MEATMSSTRKKRIQQLQAQNPALKYQSAHHQLKRTAPRFQAIIRQVISLANPVNKESKRIRERFYGANDSGLSLHDPNLGSYLGTYFQALHNSQLKLFLEMQSVDDLRRIEALYYCGRDNFDLVSMREHNANKTKVRLIDDLIAKPNALPGTLADGMKNARDINFNLESNW
jgi:hypothetical protein